MPVERYFKETFFKENSSIQIEGDEAFHLISVVRNKVGDEVELVNGMNQLGFATLREIKKGEATLFINKVISSPEPIFKVILAQAIPRLNRLDTIVEKATELGVTELWLFPGEKSERGEFSENQFHRLQRMAISAMKQCGRLDLPKIILKPKLLKWSIDFSGYFGTLNGAPFPSLLKKASPIIIFIGPESGFSKEEEDFLIKNNILGVKLHNNTLRTDTAAITALAIISVLSCPCP